jgi:hypothetical protein
MGACYFRVMVERRHLDDAQPLIADLVIGRPES